MDYSAGGNADGVIARDVWTWATANGGDPKLRIVVAAYEDGRALPPGWARVQWRARKGYAVNASNSSREVLYCSPHCLVNAPLLVGAAE